MERDENKSTQQNVSPLSTKPRGIKWRSVEERQAARRKIEAIRRAHAQALLEQSGGFDVKVLRSPKVLLGILFLLTLLGCAIIGAFKEKPSPSLQQLSFDQNRAQKSLRAVATALTLYRVHTGGWPSQRLGLYALVKRYDVPQEKWKGPYINWAYKDPWGTPYVYKMPLSPFEAPELYSCGPDKLPETNDDIRVTAEAFVCNEGTWRRAEETADEAHLEEEEAR